MTAQSHVMLSLILMVVGMEIILFVAQLVAEWMGKTHLVDHLRMMMLVLLGASALGFGLTLIWSSLSILF
jgi:hypothetical protein